jgi:hypothetical protein
VQGKSGAALPAEWDLLANPHLATPLRNRTGIIPITVPRFFGYSQLHVRLRSKTQYARITEFGIN